MFIVITETIARIEDTFVANFIVVTSIPANERLLGIDAFADAPFRCDGYSYLIRIDPRTSRSHAFVQRRHRTILADICDLSRCVRHHEYHNDIEGSNAEIYIPKCVVATRSVSVPFIGHLSPRSSLSFVSNGPRRANRRSGVPAVLKQRLPPASRFLHLIHIPCETKRRSSHPFREKECYTGYFTF